MITGIPDYAALIEQSIRCVCGLRYLVFTGGSDFDQAACEAAKDRARQLTAYFVDSRIVQVLNCLDCGYQFDLMPDEATTLVQ